MVGFVLEFYIYFLISDLTTSFARGKVVVTAWRDWGPVSSDIRVYQVISAFNIFLSVVKIFKFVQLKDEAMIIFHSVGKAGRELYFLFVVCLVILVAFISASIHLFGYEMDAFSEFSNALSSLFTIANGDFELYQEMKKVSSFAFVFTIVFVMIVGVVFFNIVIAIMSETFNAVKHASGTRKYTSKSTFRFIVKGGKKLLRKLKTRRGDAASKVSKVASDSVRLTYIANSLQPAAFTDREIEHFLQSKISKENLPMVATVDAFTDALKMEGFSQTRITALQENFKFEPGDYMHKPQDDETFDDRVEAAIKKQDATNKLLMTLLETMQHDLVKLKNQSS